MKRLTKGQGLVEFALILPILLGILLGIVEAALVIQGHLTVQHIARETARFAVTYQPLQGACLDWDNDDVITDGFPPEDDDDRQPYPYCPDPGMPDPAETDAHYYQRRVLLIKQKARDTAAGLRIRNDELALGIGQTGIDEFDANLDDAGFFGVRIWGFPAFDVDCAEAGAGRMETPWDPASHPDACLDHPGLEGLPIQVQVVHNVEIVDPLYRVITEYVTVQATSEMINEGVQVGFGNQAPPSFGGSFDPGVTTGGTPQATVEETPFGGTALPTFTPPPTYDISLTAYPEGTYAVTNLMPDDRCHRFLAVVTYDGNPVQSAWVSFSTSYGAFDVSGIGEPYTEALTNADGEALVMLCGNGPGTAEIRAWIDNLNDDLWLGEISDTAEKTWEFGPGPYIIVGDHDVVALDEDSASIMSHPITTTTSYGLWWCVDPTSSITTVENSQLLMTVDVDVNGNAENQIFTVPEYSDGMYRLETHPSGGGGCGAVDLVAYSASIQAVAALPDLTIASTEPLTACPRSVFTVSVTVDNLTSGRATEYFDVDFYIDAEGEPTRPIGVTKQWVSGIDPNGSAVVNAVLWIESSGTHELWVRTDTSDYVEEEDEENNTAIIPIEVSTGCRFCEDDGMVVIPATEYSENVAGAGGCGANRSWVESSVSGVPTMYVGGSGQECTNSWNASSAPVLRYTVNFTTTGVYRVFVRGESASQNDDTVWVSVDGSPPSNCYRLDGSSTSALVWDSAIYSSPGGCPGGSDLAVQIGTPGEHTIEVRMREDGYEWAKLMLIHQSLVGRGPSGGIGARALIMPAARALPQAQALSWVEDFEDLSNGTREDLGPTEWHTDISDLTLYSGDYFEVMNNEFRARDIDGVGVWWTEDIDISGEAAVDVSVDIRETGDLGDGDCIRLYYQLDGGSEVQFYWDCNDFGSTYETHSVSGLTGSTLRVIIRAENNGSWDTYYWDNVTVTGTGPPPTAGPTPLPTATPTPTPTPMPTPGGSDDPPATYCPAACPPEEPSPWGTGPDKPPGLLECEQLLQYGNFEGSAENLFNYWYAGAPGAYYRGSTYFHDGTLSMRLHTTLGFYPTCSAVPNPYLYQTITIPTEVYTQTTLTVSGYRLVAESESSCCNPTTDPGDQLFLKMRDGAGADLGTGNGTLVVDGGTPLLKTWQRFSIDVTDVVSPATRAGQDVQVYFHGIQEVDTECTFFYLDTLECEACTEWPIPDPVAGTSSFGGLIQVFVHHGIPQTFRGIDVWAYSPGGEVYHTTTIHDGTYHFYNVPPGSYTIYAEYWEGGAGGTLHFGTWTITVEADERIYNVNLYMS